jgi:hypothetical protein
MIITASCLQILFRAYTDSALIPGLGPVLSDDSMTNSTGAVHAVTHTSFHSHVSVLERLWYACLSMPLVVLTGAFTLVCAWSLTSLTCFHALIISLSQTTNERVRGVYFGTANAADEGCCHNWGLALCSRRVESRLPPDFSQLVVCDNSTDETIWNSQDIMHATATTAPASSSSSVSRTNSASGFAPV